MSLNDTKELNKLLQTQGLTKMRQKSQSSSAPPCREYLSKDLDTISRSAGDTRANNSSQVFCAHRQWNIFSPLSIFDYQWIPKLMTHMSEASVSPWISHHELLSIRKLMLIVTWSGLTLLPSLCIQRGIELRKLPQMKNAMGFKSAFKKAKTQTTLSVVAGKTYQVRQAEIIPFPAIKYFAERPRFPAATPSEDWKKSLCIIVCSKAKSKKMVALQWTVV